MGNPKQLGAQISKFFKSPRSLLPRVFWVAEDESDTSFFKIFNPPRVENFQKKFFIKNLRKNPFPPTST